MIEDEKKKRCEALHEDLLLARAIGQGEVVRGGY